MHIPSVAFSQVHDRTDWAPDSCVFYISMQVTTDHDQINEQDWTWLMVKMHRAVLTQELVGAIKLHQLFHGLLTDLVNPWWNHLLVPLSCGEDLLHRVLHAALNLFSGVSNVLKENGLWGFRWITGQNHGQRKETLTSSFPWSSIIFKVNYLYQL